MEAILEEYKEETEKEFYFAKPALVSRIKSSLIDVVVIFILMLIASKVISAFDLDSSIFNAIIFATICLYEPIFTSLGQTIGQKIVGLKVVRIRSYLDEKKSENINIFLSIARYITKGFLGWISLLIVTSDKYGQALHDKVGSSVVTYA